MRNGNEPRSFGRSLSYRIAAVGIAIFLFVLIAEGGFRVAGIRGVYLEPRVDVVIPGPGGVRERLPYGFVPFATIRSQYDGDLRGRLDPGGTLDHVFNSAGWRDVDHTREKPPGTFRVLGLGDSYLFGQGVRREDVVLAQLQDLLAGRNPGVPMETINTGMSGYNTAMERDLLLARGLAYDPDLILVFFVVNDVERDPRGMRGDAPKVEFFREYTNVYQRPDWLSRRSHLWSWARQRYLQQVEGARYIRRMLDAFLADEESWAYVTGAIDDVHQIATDRGIPWALVLFPFLHGLDADYPFQPIHDRIVAHCEERGIFVLDLREVYRPYHGPELWVHPTDQHPNEIAHRVAAIALGEFLAERSDHLLPGLK